MNGKIFLYAITIFTGYVFPAGGSSTMVVQPLLLTLIGTAGFMTWAAAGGLFQTFLTRHYRPFNYAMGAVLALCAVGMVV